MTDEQRQDFLRRLDDLQRKVKPTKDAIRELAARKAHILWRLNNWWYPNPQPKRAETYDDLVLIADPVKKDD